MHDAGGSRMASAAGVIEGEARSKDNPTSSEDTAAGIPTAAALQDDARSLSSGPDTLYVDSNTDADSGIGDENGLSTQSLRSSVYAYIEENGRRYHRFKEGTYFLPNDETEQDRLDLQHHLFLLSSKGRYYYAPIESKKGGIHNVLDIATGTGIWSIEFANLFPSAHVVGTDLSPIQPAYVPPNCHFEVDDAEDEWLFSQKFDYIHGRFVATCFKSHRTVFASAFDALQPGGWLELQDVVIPFTSIDTSIHGTNTERWLQLLEAGANALGRSFNTTSSYGALLRELGYVDVVEKQLHWPIGTWARGDRQKLIGRWCREDVLSGLQGWSLAVLTRGLGMSAAEVELLLMEVRREINSSWLHCYVPIYIVYGRKPE